MSNVTRPLAFVGDDDGGLSQNFPEDADGDHNHGEGVNVHSENSVFNSVTAAGSSANEVSIAGYMTGLSWFTDLLITPCFVSLFKGKVFSGLQLLNININVHVYQLQLPLRLHSTVTFYY